MLTFEIWLPLLQVENILSELEHSSKIRAGKSVIILFPHCVNIITLAQQSTRLTMDLPTLDFAKWTHGDATDRSQFSKDLAKSLIDHGFVKMINHGMSEEEIGEIFDWVRKPLLLVYFNRRVSNMSSVQSERFFKLSSEAKANMFQQLEPGPQRGWVPYGIEKTSGFARLQNKELDLLKDKLSDQRVLFSLFTLNLLYC